MYHAVNFAFHHVSIYVYLYIYENIITTEVQTYIRGISLVRTSPSSSTKQLRIGLHEQLKTKSKRLAPLTSRNKLLRFSRNNFVNYKEKIKTANNLYVLVSVQGFCLYFSQKALLGVLKEPAPTKIMQHRYIIVRSLQKEPTTK